MEYQMSQQEFAIVLANMSGDYGSFVIPKIYVEITGDFAAAAFLSQCIYWTGRSARKDGWFWKSLDDWRQELKFTKHTVEHCKKVLKPFGLETKVMRAMGAPTTHYRINFEKLKPAYFEAADRMAAHPSPIFRKRQIVLTDTANPFSENGKSITKNTANLTTNTDFAANGYANAAPPANNAIADGLNTSESSNLPDSVTQPKTKSSKKALKEGGKGDTSPFDLSIVPAISVSITPTNVKCVVDKNDVRHYIAGDASKSICGRTAFVEKECYGGAYEKQCEKCATTHALASICYQEVSVALNQNISVLNRVLKDLRPTLEQLRCFYARWKAEDFRGKKGARPSPSMVKAEWANYSTPFLVQTEGDSLALTTPEPQPDPQCPFCAGSGYSSVYINTRTNTIVTHDEYVRNFSNIDYQRTSERCKCVS